MSAIVQRSNDALVTNPNVFNYPAASDINITSHGSDVYWAVCAIMATASLVFVGLSFTQPRRNRIFHYITAAITLTASIAYFTMASNLGYAAIYVEFHRSSGLVNGNLREVFYVRYIDWVVTTPLLLLDLLLTCGLPWPTILFTVFLDEVMIITGLVGALTASSYKWGYFVFAMVALFAIAWNVCYVGLKHSTRLGSDVKKVYAFCGVLTIFLWFLYPIAWGLSEGGNVISPDSEAVFYGVLDVLAKVGFGAALLFGHRNIDPARLGLHIRDYDDDIVTDEKYNKHHAATGIAAAPYHTTNTTTTNTTTTDATNAAYTTGHNTGYVTPAATYNTTNPNARETIVGETV